MGDFESQAIIINNSSSTYKFYQSKSTSFIGAKYLCLTKRKYAGVICLQEKLVGKAHYGRLPITTSPLQMWSPSRPTLPASGLPDAENPNNKVLLSAIVQRFNFPLQVHFSKEKDEVSLYGTPKEEPGQVNTSR